MTGGFSIRVGVADDAEAIHAALGLLAEAVGLPGKVTSTVADIAEAGFGPDPAFATLIAEDQDGFAGLSLFFRSFSTWRGETGAYVQDFVVLDRHRGTELAARLMAATARRAGILWGARYLRLAVDLDNERARRFYVRCGLAWSRSEAIHAAYGPAFASLAGQDVTIWGQE